MWDLSCIEFKKFQIRSKFCWNRESRYGFLKNGVLEQFFECLENFISGKTCSLVATVESGLEKWLKTWYGKESSGEILLNDFFIIFLTSDSFIPKTI